MSETPSEVVQVRVDSLASYYSSLAAALTEAGLGGSQMNEIFSKHVRAECGQCGIQITGDEIGRFAVTDATTEPSDPKQARLRQGYCARVGCESHYYSIHFTDSPNTDWAKIRERAERLANGAQSAAQEDAAARAQAARKRRWVRLGVGVGAILILLLCRHILYYGYVPLLQKPHKFTVDPASVNHGTAQ
ncbi:MAG: hypothetical protein DME26_11205 [Verrucomicrobia bacterium]|nr:MAG: hypothetical protein DME26_11205 [Verrucomicrobiota bacterium]